MALIRCIGNDFVNRFKFVALASSGTTSTQASYTALADGKLNAIATAYGAWTGAGGTISVDVKKNGTSILSDLTVVNDNEEVTTNNHVTSYDGVIEVEANDVITIDATVAGQTPSYTCAMLQIE